MTHCNAGQPTHGASTDIQAPMVPQARHPYEVALGEACVPSREPSNVSQAALLGAWSGHVVLRSGLRIPEPASRPLDPKTCLDVAEDQYSCALYTRKDATFVMNFVPNIFT